MQKITIEQFRTFAREGKLVGVEVIGEGGAFYVQAQSQQGSLLLTRTRSDVPREFKSVTKLLALLLEIGINNIYVNVKHWRPELGSLLRESCSDKAMSLREAFQTSKLTNLLEARIREADSRDSVLHDANHVFNELQVQYET